MDSTDMEVFLTVARTGNVSTAALALNITQSALSKRIKNMEEDLGIKLFFRGKGQKGVEITNLGLEFMELAQRWQGLWEDMHGLQHLQASSALNIGVLDSIQALTVHLTTALYGRNPGMRVRLLARPSSSMYDEIDKRVIDVGFSHLERQMPSVQRQRLFSEPFVVVHSGEHESGKQHVLAPEDLDQDQEVFMRWWSPGYVVWHENHWDMQRSRRLSTSSVHLQAAFIGMLGRWGIMPYSLARQMCDSVKLFMYTLEPVPPPPRVCYLLTHKQPRSGVKGALVLFHECLEATLRKDMPWATLGF